MFEQSAMTAAICQLLKGTNDAISYDAIISAAGADNLTAARQALVSARRCLERDEGIVFETIRGKGLRLLDDRDRVQSTQAIRRKIHRQSKAGLQRLQTVQNYTGLPQADRVTADLNRTLFAMTQQAAKPTADVDRAVAGPALPNLAALAQTKVGIDWGKESHEKPGTVENIG